MASISSLGVGSGLDLSGLLDQLRSAEREKLQPIVTQQSDEKAKISAFGRLQTALDGFQDAVAKLNDASLYSSLSTSVQGEGVMATAGADASPGRYEVSVTQSARGGSLATSRIDDINLEDPLTDAGAQLTLTFGDGSTMPIDLAADSTLGDIRDTINATPDTGVTASIINDGTGNRLVLASSETGEAAAITDMTFTGLSVGATLAKDADTLRAGRDAELEINGIAITSPSNRVEGAIQGITLDLDDSASGQTSTVVVERDSDSLREAVTGFVSAYNEMKSTVGRMTAVTGDADTAGELVGDRTVRTIQTRLSRDLGESVLGGELELMSQVGISLTPNGRLELDQAKLDEAIAGNPQGVAGFFAGDSEAAGMAGRLSGTLEQVLGDSGMLKRSIESSETRIDNLGDRYARTERSIESTIDRYRTQFGQLDSMLAQMNSMSDYLTQQFSALDAQLGRK
ncbi:flagellar filament capping protein FliD [Halomonas urumqiensis]|uniref:Flagellar hook-associated protein 2 n=1 Tax=Halomonas urumqiensis TaxID=1684789 RepID=A0A2N7UNS9_9GAMM|nr:flagellar filament capping protein FliD [Halomonas urumqiensis]PMR82094.1 flagellar hook protein [Halomonas urumqiensis]PTB02575.1 flagellar hook protein [Halomonas urumqiensis]GHE21054.1 flagellar hook-associated protein 2 [Halomonas urumqiensis]